MAAASDAYRARFSANIPQRTTSRHAIAVGLQMDFKPVNYLFLLGIPAALPPAAHEQLTKIFFEALNVSNLFIIERPVLQLYSCASVSGIVVDTASEYTDVAVIIDSVIHQPSLLRCSIGEKDCDAYLVHLLIKANPDLASELTPEGHPSPLAGDALFTAVSRLVQILKDGQYIRFSSAALGFIYAPGADRAAGTAATGTASGEIEDDEEEGVTDVAKAIASGKVAKILTGSAGGDGITPGEMDTLLVPNPVSSARGNIVIGAERHRYAEPLFDPTVLQAIEPGNSAAAVMGKRKCKDTPLQEIIAVAVSLFPDPSRRGMTWEYIVVTGVLALVKGGWLYSSFL